MKSQFENDYKAFHAAAVTLGARMLAEMPDAQLEAMERMTQSGAKLLIEIELPNCKEISLILREVEGKVWPICKLGKSQ